MKSRYISRIVVVILAAQLIFVQAKAEESSQASTTKTERPNILLILSDDMGISDLGCYGSEISTPNLDRLADSGVRFRSFYNTGRCCPTRACLLTGLYPHQAGIGHMMDDRQVPGYRGDLNNQCVTIAEVLRPAGYRTYMVGKWHVTKNVSNPEGHIRNWPQQRGFDECYATLSGAGNYFQPAGLVRGNQFVSTEADPKYTPSKGVYYFTDACSDNASAFLAEHSISHADQPFFLYLAYTAAHWPMQALPEDIEKYRGRYDGGWDVLRQERLAKMKRIGLVPDSTELSPRDHRVPDWESLSDEDRKWYASRMEVYAAMIDNLDQGIGRVIQTLKDSGQYENTIIFFIQDNGGCAEEIGSQGRKVVYARGQAENENDRCEPLTADEPSIQRHDVWLRDGRPVRTGRVTPGPADAYLSYGLPWANVSDTPFRMYKHFVHEGGVSTPLIVSWPEGIEHRDWVSQPGHLIDIMATCVDLGQAEYPTRNGDFEIAPMEGVSLMPAIHGQELDRQQPIFFEHEGNRAVRDGKWKLVAKGENGPWQLYNIEEDRAEMNNLVNKRPRIAQRLAESWEEWAVRVNVYPKQKQKNR